MIKGRKKKYALLLCSLLSYSSVVLANSDGMPVITPDSCDDSYSSLTFVCEALESVIGVGLCKETGNTCVRGEQEMFTGINIELASPTNIKPWTGFGGLGEMYQLSHLCLMRDLKTPLKAEAIASTPLGDVKSKQEVSLLSFDIKNREFVGYQRLKACAPAIGCIDGVTQKISLKGVKTALKGLGKKVGGYDIYDSFALSLETEGFIQGLDTNIPAVDVFTPYGKISASPKFGFGKTSGYILSPYDGNKKSMIVGAYGKAKLLDLYGRNPGVVFSQNFPTNILLANTGINSPAIGWISQIGVGSRDSNLKNTPWSAGSEEYPIRPDLDLMKARSKAEKVPNFQMGANIKVAYSPVDLLPAVIKNNGFIDIDFQVWATPLVETFFSSQFNQWHSEIAKWSGKNGDYTPLQMNQFKGLSMSHATSVTSRYALDAGVDLRLHLHIPLPWPLDDIDINLIDIHPQTTVLEKVDSQSKKGSREAYAYSQADKILTEKKLFQAFQTFDGPKNGQDYVAACLKSPTVTGEGPSSPTYTPGNPEDLTKGILYPCNVCVGMNDYKYKDEKGVEQMIKGFLQTLFPSDFNTKPTNLKWSCNQVEESGCFDMCSYNVNTGKLSVVETAKEMIMAGKVKNMPRKCM